MHGLTTKARRREVKAGRRRFPIKFRKKERGGPSFRPSGGGSPPFPDFEEEIESLYFDFFRKIGGRRSQKSDGQNEGGGGPTLALRSLRLRVR